MWLLKLTYSKKYLAYVIETWELHILARDACFFFNHTILLWCVWTCFFMQDGFLFKKLGARSFVNFVPLSDLMILTVFWNWFCIIIMKLSYYWKLIDLSLNKKFQVALENSSTAVRIYLVWEIKCKVYGFHKSM